MRFAWIFFFLFCGIAEGKDPWPVHPSIGMVVSDAFWGSPYMGSCALVDDNHVLTCAHVVVNTDLNVVFGSKGFKATIVAVDLYRDWAILRLNAPSLSRPIRVFNGKIAVGDTFYAMGFGQFREFPEGEIDRNYQYGYSSLLFAGENCKFTGRVELGDSGGPILNKDSEIVAVVSKKKEKGECALSMADGTLYGFVSKWVDSGKEYQVSRP